VRSGQAINLEPQASSYFGGPSNGHSLNFFSLEQVSPTFLIARAKIADYFLRHYFACGKLEFTSAIFPIFPVTS